MAAIPAVVRDVSPRGDGSTLLVTWSNFTQADTCNPVSFPDHPDKSIMAAGTFGAASVALNGSNDGVNYAALNSPNSTAIALTGLGVRAVLENTLYVQPVATGGAGQTLAITMLVRMTNPLRT